MIQFLKKEKTMLQPDNSMLILPEFSPAKLYLNNLNFIRQLELSKHLRDTVELKMGIGKKNWI